MQATSEGRAKHRCPLPPLDRGDMRLWSTLSVDIEAKKDHAPWTEMLSFGLPGIPTFSEVRVQCERRWRWARTRSSCPSWPPKPRAAESQILYHRDTPSGRSKWHYISIKKALSR